ncbi:MAG: hypothetical protein L0Z53_14925 [Acidobacteriales bacterium]|nr:hypothetical protein [Terriglobales bacterium]
MTEAMSGYPRKPVGARPIASSLALCLTPSLADATVDGVNCHFENLPSARIFAAWVAAALIYMTICSASCLAALPANPADARATHHNGCEPTPAVPAHRDTDGDCGTHDHDASWNVAKKALGFVPVLPAVEFLADRPAASSPGVVTWYDATTMIAVPSVIVLPLRI